MEPPMMFVHRNLATPNADFFPNGYKRTKLSCDTKDYGSTTFRTITQNGTREKKEDVSPNVIDYSDPFAVSNMLEAFTSGKYGSVTKDIEALISRRRKMVNPFFEMYPSLSNISMDGQKNLVKEVSGSTDQQVVCSTQSNVICLEDDCVAGGVKKPMEPVVIPDSDDEETEFPKPLFEEVVLGKPTGLVPVKDIVLRDFSSKRLYKEEKVVLPKVNNIPKNKGTDGEKNKEVGIEKTKGVYLGVEDDVDDQSEARDDGLGDIWQEMSVALECSKDVSEYQSSDEHTEEDDDCEHSFVLKDDIGYVCRVCGVIERRIETIIDIQYSKVKRSTRTSIYEPRNAKDRESTETGVKLSEDELMVTEISAHPRHMKQMKPHQVEGFNFLCSNLVVDNPGGCILAHAPGSGKTFMIISFIQSFLAKYPHAKPLVVLPKGILATWKREFETWQVEDIPLYDFYSVKADNRSQQLEVLKKWVDQKSILFLGYKQFSTIIYDSGLSSTASACQEILLKAPSILILDEGHTPRNENTDVLQSLAKVQTPRKVVLSGTLYQNHVKEVFNILNLVRPKFLRIDTSKALIKRIMSKVNISGVRKQVKAGGEAAFYDLVENTLQKDENFERKVSVIHDLREMTSKVLHYYKGDFLDELPGLVDFTVLLSLTSRQKTEAQKSLKKIRRKFKISSVGSAVYLHPKLTSTPENSVMTDDKMDELLNNIIIKDGVKAKFFLNMLNLCECSGEKLLVFSQYLCPLKFLERLAVKEKCWLPGREVFAISGESSSEHREWSMDRFNNSPEAKVLFGSIRACGEGISLVGASRIIILDVHLNPSVTRQAIGRAFRPGQKKKVYAYRLVAAESPEEEDHSTCFQKELIAKMWFEWNQYCGYRDFQVEKVDVNECDDLFLESPLLREDVKGLYRR